MLVDGVFTEAPDGSLRFHPAPPPTDAEVGRLLTTIRTRILRLLRRRGVLGEAEEGDVPDPLAETSLALAGIASAAVQGRSAIGHRPGARVLQIGRVPGILWITSTGVRHCPDVLAFAWRQTTPGPAPSSRTEGSGGSMRALENVNVDRHPAP